MEIEKTKGSNLLLLKSIQPKDIKCGLKQAPVIEKVMQAYSDIPKRFTCVEDWPHYTNLKCWTCDQIPTEYPKFIPSNPQKDDFGRDCCDIVGNFCEWNCAVHYIMKEMPRDTCWDYLQALYIFESKFSGLRKEKIMPSPPKTIMRAYCGNRGLTPSQYREETNALNNKYNLICYKMEHFKNAGDMKLK